MLRAARGAGGAARARFTSPGGRLWTGCLLPRWPSVRHTRSVMQSRGATMRTSDDERQRVADFLRDACGDGRLSPEELEERLDQLFAGSTVADIVVLVRDLPGGGAVIPRLDRRAVPRRVAVASVPARRRGASPAVPIGATLLVGGLAWLVFAALPPLMAIMLGAIVLSFAIVVGMFAVAMAPVGLSLCGISWLVQRMFRGRQVPPHAWPGGPRMRR